MNKKILYIDMDKVLVDFKTGIERVPEEALQQYEGKLDEVPGSFALMPPHAKRSSVFRQAQQRLRYLHPLYRSLGEPIRLVRQASVGEEIPRNRRLQASDTHAQQTPEPRRLSGG